MEPLSAFFLSRIRIFICDIDRSVDPFVRVCVQLCNLYNMQVVPVNPNIIQVEEEYTVLIEFNGEAVLAVVQEN